MAPALKFDLPGEARGHQFLMQGFETALLVNHQGFFFFLNKMTFNKAAPRQDRPP